MRLSDAETHYTGPQSLQFTGSEFTGGNGYRTPGAKHAEEMITFGLCS